MFEEYQWPIVTWIGRQLELRENEPELFLPYSIVLSRKGAKNGSFWWITQVGLQGPAGNHYHTLPILEYVNNTL